MNILYKNPNELSSLITNTYILSAVTTVIFLLIAMLISKMIAYEGGKNPKDAGRRKVWFWITGVIATVAFFCYNFFFVKEQIAPNPALRDSFNVCTAISTGLVLLIYVVLGFVLSRFVCQRGKFGTVFPAK